MIYERRRLAGTCFVVLVVVGHLVGFEVGDALVGFVAEVACWVG